MQLTQHKLWTRKTSLHSRWNFISTFTELRDHDDERWPNGSDVKYVFPLTNGSDVQCVFPLNNGSDVKYVFLLSLLFAGARGGPDARVQGGEGRADAHAAQETGA